MARILVVDDESAIRETLQGLLERHGHVITPAENGLVALERFDQGTFDLVLSDVIMPEMNGFDLLQALQPQLHERIPFVILSSHDDRDGIAAAIYAGAFDYLRKPFEESHVAEVIGRALEQANAWAKQGHAPPPLRAAPARVVEATPEASPEETPSGVAAIARQGKVVCVPSPQDAAGSAVPKAGPLGRLLRRLTKR